MTAVADETGRLESLEGQLRRAGVSTDEAGLLLQLALLHQLEELALAGEPNHELTLHNSVTLSAAGAGKLVFKNGSSGETWKVTQLALDSRAAHNFNVKVYADASVDTPLNLVAASSTAAATFLQDRNSPVLVAPGHLLIFSVTGGTASDPLEGTIQGWRQKRLSASVRVADHFAKVLGYGAAGRLLPVALWPNGEPPAGGVGAGFKTQP